MSKKCVNNKKKVSYSIIAKKNKAKIELDSIFP